MLKLTKKILLLVAMVFSIMSTNFSESMDIRVMPQDMSIASVLMTSPINDEDQIETVEADEIVTDDAIIELNSEGYLLAESYKYIPPDRINLNAMVYNEYNIAYYYVVAVRNAVNIRQSATTESPVIKTLGLYGKINIFEKVKGQYFPTYDSDEWYHVYWYENSEIVTGYIYAPIVSFRTFRFDTALDQIERLENFFETENHMGKINNYKNINGRAPLINNSVEDAYGNKRDQSAPLYEENSTASNFRYIADGEIFDILDDTTNLYYVYVPYFDTYGYIPKKYISTSNSVQTLTQVVFVDIQNQNIATLELSEGEWIVKSISFATTGKEAEYKEKTIPGYYAAIQKKDKFLYLDDVTKELDGYAPYAIRFSGGAYLHGFPVNYRWVTEQILISAAEYDENGVMIKEAVYKERRIGGPIDPGHIEYSYTLGTIPLSHKCVRNTTSHAVYMYNWIKLDQSIIIIEE